MAYCRFSTNHHSGDVYVYASADGVVTCLAAGRFQIESSSLGPQVDPSADFDGWNAGYRGLRALLEASEVDPIGLACDGQVFTDDCPGQAAARLADLAELGYRVSGGAVAALQAGGECEVEDCEHG